MYIVIFENHDQPIAYDDVSDIANSVLCDDSYSLSNDVVQCVSVFKDYVVCHTYDELQDMIDEWAGQEPLDERKEWGTV